MALKQGSGTFTECDIHNNDHPGIRVQEQGSGGLFTECSVHGNGYAGVQVCNGGSPLMKRCDIHSNKSVHSALLGGDIGAGVLVFDGGAGRFEGCNNYDNSRAVHRPS